MLNTKNDSGIIRIAILDDHQIVIDGIKLLLRHEENIQVVLESTRGDEFLALLKSVDVDLVLTDVIMPRQMSGIEVAQHIKQHFPQVAILVLSMNEDTKVVHQLITEVGVDGFVSKAIGMQELLGAIEQIAKGGQFYSKEVLNMLQLNQKVHHETQKLLLSSRELEIVKCIDSRMSNKQIAEALFISERTVETHRKNIYRKTNTKGEAALLSFLSSKGII